MDELDETLIEWLKENNIKTANELHAYIEVQTSAAYDEGVHSATCDIC